jgi:hypothetical protein
MSSGGSNPSSPTGATGDQPTTATINSPITKGPNAPEAPGGKGGFPSAQNPYAQQQPQIYTPPQQQSFYDQAFNHPYYQQPPQYYQQQPQYYQQAPQYYQQQPQYYQSQPQINSYGLGSFSGGMGNAYARRPRFSPPSPFNGGRMSPIEAQPPMDEMQMGVMGGGEDYWRNKRGYGQFTGPVGAVPVQATQGVVSDNMNNPAYQQQMAASNMTDYQRLMQLRQMASQPQPNQLGFGGLGLNQMPVTAPSDFEIANSLGYKDPSAGMVTDMRAKMPHEYEAENAARDAKAKEYLNSIGYGQSGFDASKYEVKRQQPTLTGGSPFSGLRGLMSGM